MKNARVSIYTYIHIYIGYMVRSVVDKTFDYFAKTKYYCTYNSVLHRVISYHFVFIIAV